MINYSVKSEQDTLKLDVKTQTNKLDVKKTEYLISLARTGGQGSPGEATSIGGLPINATEAQEGDILTVIDLEWKVARRTTLTDGGNF